MKVNCGLIFVIALSVMFWLLFCKTFTDAFI